MHVTAELKIWDVEKGCEILTLPAHHTQLVDAIAVSLNGGIAVSASRDKTLRVWDVAKGGLLAVFTCDSEPKCCAAVDDGHLIVAGDAAGHLHFLRLEEPKL